MRALVTGGAGFIGSHLVRALLALGWRVDVIDNLSTGSFSNLEAVNDHPNFCFVEATVLDETTVQVMIEAVDVVFHLAAAVGAKLIVEDPIRTIKTNINSTELVLYWCAHFHVPVLITSTSEVYGKSTKEFFREEDDLVLGSVENMRWCYAGTKIIDEFLAKAYHRDKKLPVVIARLFNTIGPRQTGQYGMVVPRFIAQARANAPITVYGDGHQRRSFTWVGDVVDALIALIQEPHAYGNVYNIGHYKEITILGLAHLIREMTSSSSEIELVPYVEDMQRRRPDLTKINSIIGYKPSLTLTEMLGIIIRAGYCR